MISHKNSLTFAQCMYMYTDWSKLHSATITGPNEVTYLFWTSSGGKHFSWRNIHCCLAFGNNILLPTVSSANQPGEPDVLLTYSEILTLHDMTKFVPAVNLINMQVFEQLLHPAESV